MKPGDWIHWRRHKGILKYADGRHGLMITAQGPVAVLIAECEAETDWDARLVRERNARTATRRADREARLEARYAEVRQAVEQYAGESYRIYRAIGYSPRTCCEWLRAAGCDYCKTETGWRWVNKKS
jgi:hypothetical protein